MRRHDSTDIKLLRSSAMRRFAEVSKRGKTDQKLLCYSLRLRATRNYNPSLLCGWLKPSIGVMRRIVSTTMPDIKLNGILPPVTTPFNGRGDVDYAALSSNIARYNETGLVGYVALGSNGEAVHLTADERRRVIETVKRAATSAHTIVVGVNELSTRAAIEAARAAAALGADAVL